METPLVPQELSSGTKKVLWVGAALVFTFVTVAICLTVWYGIGEYHGGFVIIAISTIIILVCTGVLLNLMQQDKLEERVKLVALAQAFGLVLLSAALFAVIFGPVPSPTYNVGGSVSGLVSSAVKLTDSLSKPATNLSVNAPTCGPWSFASKYTDGQSWKVVITEQPLDGAECEIGAGGTGKVSGKDVTSIRITCIVKYSVGGRIQGLQTGTEGVTLINQETRDIVLVQANGNWAFPNKVTSNTKYNVQVQTNPRSQTCSVGGGQGTVTNADVTDINVVCTP